MESGSYAEGIENGKEAGKDQVNIETLESGDENHYETTGQAVHKVHNRTTHT